VRGLAVIHSQTEGCACPKVDVRSGRLWIVLFATGLSTETLGFTSSDFRWVIPLSWLIVNLLQLPD